MDFGITQVLYATAMDAVVDSTAMAAVIPLSDLRSANASSERVGAGTTIRPASSTRARAGISRLAAGHR